MAKPKAKKVRITATRFAKNAADIFDRVQFKGERFVVERRGRVVGEFGPARKKKKTWTGSQLADFLESFGPLPADVVASIERARDDFKFR